jgi:hypothetical protein
VDGLKALHTIPGNNIQYLAHMGATSCRAGASSATPDL